MFIRNDDKEYTYNFLYISTIIELLIKYLCQIPARKIYLCEIMHSYSCRNNNTIVERFCFEIKLLSMTQQY